MPQTAELSHEGYSALFNACCRFDILPAVSVFSSLMDLNDVNSERIEHMAGLVPYKEWRYVFNVLLHDFTFIIGLTL
jgi:hypothetical protein